MNSKARLSAHPASYSIATVEYCGQVLCTQRWPEYKAIIQWCWSRISISTGPLWKPETTWKAKDAWTSHSWYITEVKQQTKSKCSEIHSWLSMDKLPPGALNCLLESSCTEKWRFPTILANIIIIIILRANTVVLTWVSQWTAYMVTVNYTNKQLLWSSNFLSW